MRVIHCEQMSEAWFQARMGRPTASNAAKILTSTGKKSAQWKTYLYEIVAERAGHASPAFEPTEAMLEGIRREEESRDAYAFTTGRDVEQVGLVVCDEIGASCSPDGLIEGYGGLELKNPKPGTYYAEMDAGKVPTKYIPQIHASLAVTAFDVWDYCVYLTGEPPIVRTVGRDDYTATMRQALADFCGELDETCRRLGVPLLDELSEAA